MVWHSSDQQRLRRHAAILHARVREEAPHRRGRRPEPVRRRDSLLRVLEDDPGFPMPTSPKIDSCLLTHNYAYMGGAIACFKGRADHHEQHDRRQRDGLLTVAGIALYYARARSPTT